MDKLVSGAAAFRDKKGEVEWFLVKARLGDKWELPKSDVRRGESSVQSIIRYTQENLGVKAIVLDEAGRLNVTSTKQGSPIDEKIIFYLMHQNKASLKFENLRPGVENKPEQAKIPVEGEWLKYAVAKKRLSLIREQKLLAQSMDLVKEMRKKKSKKS